jgi:transposase InsO family protein
VHTALQNRRPKKGLIFHSDRGSEFLGAPFRNRLESSGVQQSMTRGGAPDENAHMESFFHSLKAELTQRRLFATVFELRQALRR